MKTKDLKVGGIYHDGKVGVRELVALEDAEVSYKLLSAKQATSWSYRDGERRTLIGQTQIMTASAFASWAKAELDLTEAAQLLLMLEAKKIKLSPGEQAFIFSALKETEGQITAGMRIGISHTEGRAVAGLAKKGMVVRDRDTDEAEFTELGAAWVRVQPTGSK